MRRAFSLLSPWLEVSLAFLAVFAVSLAKAMEHDLIHQDTVWQLLRVKDCVEGSSCHLSLATHSVVGVRHGALFLHFLAAVHWLGGDLAAARLILALLSGLAGVLLYLLVRRSSGAPIAALSIVVYAPLVAVEHSTTWNSTMTPLFAVLCLGLLERYLDTRRTLHFLLLSLMLSLGIQVHLAFAVLVFPLAVALLGSQRKRWSRSLPSSLGLVALGVILVSPGMLDIDHGVLSARPVLIGLPLVAAVAAGSFVAYRSLEPRVKPLFAMLLVSYPPLATFFAIAAWNESRYMHVLLPGIIFLGGSALARLFALFRHRQPFVLLQGTGSLLALLILVWFVTNGLTRMMPDDSRPAPTDEAWRGGPTMAEARVVAGHLDSLELGFADAFRSLRGGSRSWPLLNGLAYFIDSDEGAGTDDDLAFFRLPSSAARHEGPGWTYLFANGNELIALKRYRPWLNWETFDACVMEPGDECALSKIHLAWTTQEGRERLTSRAVPFLPAMPGAPSSGFDLLLRVPIEVPPGEEQRLVVVPTIEGRIECRGRIEDTAGITVEGALPATQATVRSTDTFQRGHVLFSWTFGKEGCSGHYYRRMPPPVLELQGASELSFVARSALELQPRDAQESETRVGAGARIMLSTLSPPPLDEPRKDARAVALEPTVPLFYALLALLFATMVLGASIATCAAASRRAFIDDPVEADRPD